MTGQVLQGSNISRMQSTKWAKWWCSKLAWGDSDEGFQVCDYSLFLDPSIYMNMHIAELEIAYIYDD